jgi:hypothetical protein
LERIEAATLEHSVITIAINVLAAIFFFWASKVYTNWNEDVRQPFLAEFIGHIYRRLGLRYFYRHRNVMVTLGHLICFIDATFGAIDAAIDYVI